LVNFSSATPGGSGSVVEVVPEPAPLSFLAAGAALLGAWKRRGQ
jgi:hypothetical protein